ncbi:hypothetical protein [Reinekea sp.]|nr:hypothetical protein [Reinekea sp.]
MWSELGEPGRHREVARVMRASWAEQGRVKYLVTLSRELFFALKGIEA